MLHAVRKPLTTPAVVVDVVKEEEVRRVIVTKAKKVVEDRSITMT